MALTINSRKRLNNGTQIPRLGFGTWEIKEPNEAYNAVKWAVDAGYRHIDTARIYENEGPVGKAIAECGVERKELFVTTKLWNTDQANAEQAFADSLKRLGMDYVDLYLVHWPEPRTRKEAWKSLEKSYETGAAKAIGVSNYTTRHLDELLADCKIVPAVNQVELSPFLYQKELIEYCAEKGIAVEAYSPLTHGVRLADPKIAAIAANHGKTNAQVMLRWALQKDLVVIPKSTKKDRINENASIFDFELTDQDVAALDSLDEGFRTCWNPENIRWKNK